MSVDISLIDKDGNIAEEVNWFRNPFGLASWVDNNCSELLNYNPKDTINKLPNMWAYDRSRIVNRKKYLIIVLEYWRKIRQLDKTYFFFALWEYRQFIQPNYSHLPLEKTLYGTNIIKGEKYSNDGRLMVPVGNFKHAVFLLNNPSTEKYKKWYQQLIRVAVKMQSDKYEYRCTG